MFFLFKPRLLWAAPVLCACAVLLAGCTVTTPRLDADERARLAAESQAALFAGQEPLAGPLTLAEAVTFGFTTGDVAE